MFDWLKGLKGALPSEHVSAQQYPKTFAWIDRFNHALKDAKARAPKPTVLKGDAAAQRILSAPLVDKEIGVNEGDPLGLRKGQVVSVHPIDSGVRYKDEGTLIGLNDDEIVITAESTVRLHYPRTGFRVAALGGSPKL